MKKIRMIISIFLVAIIAIGWISVVGEIAKNNSTVSKKVELAQTYNEKGLYQKAIAAYTEVLAIKEKKSVRDEMLETYKLGLSDGVIDGKDYSAIFTLSTELYPKESSYWECLLEYYVKNSSFANAYDAYKDMIRSGAKSDKLNELTVAILYSYTEKTTDFEQSLRSPEGYYTLCNDEFWGIAMPDLEFSDECEYKYISPVNSDLTSVYVSSKGTRIKNNSIVQNILSDEITLSKAYSEGFLPVCENEKWRYIYTENDEYMFGTYNDVSSFADGKAAIKQGESWSFINTKGENASDKTFKDIKLYQNGTYIYSNVMVASEDGVYKMYNSKLETLSDFSAKDMDSYYGGLLAYQGDNGKWGFVDIEGNVKIEPQYDKAKSFSNGLAAVCNGTEWGFINSNNTLVIDYQYFDAGYFTSKGVCDIKLTADFTNFIVLRYF